MCRREEDTSYPAPNLSPLSAPAPARCNDGRHRGQRPRRSESQARWQPALTPCPRPPGCAKATARSSGGLPPHFSRSCWISSSSCSNRPRDRLGEKSSDSLQSHPGNLSGSRACSAPDPEACRARPPNAPLPEAGAEAVSAVAQLPPLQPSAAAALRVGVGGVAGWRMLLSTEGRGRNGNRNRRRRCLTEPSAPVTEAEREAARAGQSLTARDRARAESQARDPEQRQPHSVRKGRGRVDWELRGRGEGREPGAERTGPLGSAGDNARTRLSALTTRAGGETRASASVRARMGARAPQCSWLLGEGAHAPAAATYGDPGVCLGFSPPLLAPPADRVAAASAARQSLRPQRDPETFSCAASAHVGDGSNMSVGRPLLLEGRRLRGARV